MPPFSPVPPSIRLAKAAGASAPRPALHFVSWEAFRPMRQPGAAPLWTEAHPPGQRPSRSQTDPALLKMLAPPRQWFSCYPSHGVIFGEMD